MRRSCWLLLSVLGLAGCGPGASPLSTVAEIELVRPGVKVGGRPLASTARLLPLADVAIVDGGQAWLRHDAGLSMLLDSAGRAAILDEGVELSAGRAWIEGGAGARAILAAGGIRVDLGGAALEATRAGEALRLHVARGEVAYRLPGGARGIVRAGENADLGASATVTPAVMWDDWTGGLAWPDPGNRGAVPAGRGEIGARRPGSLGEARFPLAVTRLEVRTAIDDDLAVTRVVESFFNPASATLEGIYRMRVPEGAVLQRFAIDRDGRWADGYVKERETARRDYQAQVYEGSTLDPALLEWEAPGMYRARIYPIPGGATRRILVEYSEWLTPSGDGEERHWRYPLGGDPRSVIDELDVEVDARQSGATRLRAGLDARVEGKRVTLERTDFRPRSDLVVDLVGKDRKEGESRAYRAPHRMLQRVARLISREDDYYLWRAVPLPFEAADRRPPLDLAILVDISAATDETHLQLARTAAEALLRHLDERDRVVLLGADLELFRPGKARGKEAVKLAPASRGTIDELLDALARQGVGGATDLGAVLTQAASLLEPGRRGAVVYIGDAMPTVGELDLKALRERLDRLPAPLRLYGVAVGDEANLGLLEGLTGDGGLSLRVGDRATAAAAALRILGHASRRVLHRVQVDLGPGLDRVYPRRPVTVVEGDALQVVGRVRSGLPKQARLTGLLEGKPVDRRFAISSAAVDGGDDLRLRWAWERLRQLLADGASGEEVAELGTRQNLVTPFTSYYVPSAGELSALVAPEPEVRAAGCAAKAPSSAEEKPEPAPSFLRRSDDDHGGKGKRQKEGEGQMGARRAQQNLYASKSAKDRAEPPPAPPSAAPAKPMEQPPADEEAAEKKADKTIEAGDRAGTAGDSFGVGGLGLIGRGSGGGGARPIVAAPKPEASREARHRATELAKNAGILGVLRGGDDGRARDQNEGEEAVDEEQAVLGDGGVEDGPRRLIVRIDIFTHRARHCSPASGLPLGERAVLWRERLSVHAGVSGAVEIWQDALGTCELRSWSDRRALLRAMISSVGGAGQMVALHQAMSEDAAAQEFLRKAILGRVRSPSDLRVVYEGLGLSEDVKWSLVEEITAKAPTAEARLAALQQMAQRWPGDLRLKLKIMEALEALKRLAEARRLADDIRLAPNADARARTLVGELLVRLGDEPAARRAFSEIVEFAPEDPVARRRLGDLYRAHGWFEEAYRQYQTLATLAPGDMAVLLLQAAAAAGAGRTDEALRLEQRVSDGAEPGAETGLARVAVWWSTLRLALLRDAARRAGDAAELARLTGRTRRASVLREVEPLRVFLTWAHPEADCELAVQLPGMPLAPASEVAPEHGLASIGSREPLSGPVLVEVRRPPGAALSGLRYAAQLVVVLDLGGKGEALHSLPVQFEPGREAFRFRVAGGKVEVMP